MHVLFVHIHIHMYMYTTMYCTVCVYLCKELVNKDWFCLSKLIRLEHSLKIIGWIQQASNITTLLAATRLTPRDPARVEMRYRRSLYKGHRGKYTPTCTMSRYMYMYMYIHVYMYMHVIGSLTVHCQLH